MKLLDGTHYLFVFDFSIVKYNFANDIFEFSSNMALFH